MKTIEEKSEEYGRENTSHLGRLEGIDSMLENAFIAGAKASQEWISVDDELPESFNEVLTKVNDEIVIAYISDNGEYEWYLQGESAFRGAPINVDFWRPIEYK